MIDSISSGISDVLDSVAGVIESIGNSARNAGEGFQLFADGVSTIVGLPLVDTAASLAAVATGIGEIALAGSGVGEVGDCLLYTSRRCACSTGNCGKTVSPSTFKVIMKGSLTGCGLGIKSIG